MRRSRKPFGVQASRGFKSLPLRLNKRLPGQEAAPVGRLAVFEPQRPIQRRPRTSSGVHWFTASVAHNWRTVVCFDNGAKTHEHLAQCHAFSQRRPRATPPFSGGRVTFLDGEPLWSGGVRSSNRSAQTRDVHRRLQTSVGLRRQWRTTGARLPHSTTLRTHREAMPSPRLLRQRKLLPPASSATCGATRPGTAGPFITREGRVRDARPLAGTFTPEIALFHRLRSGRVYPRVAASGRTYSVYQTASATGSSRAARTRRSRSRQSFGVRGGEVVGDEAPARAAAAPSSSGFSFGNAPVGYYAHVSSQL